MYNYKHMYKYSSKEEIKKLNTPGATKLAPKASYLGTVTLV